MANKNLEAQMLLQKVELDMAKNTLGKQMLE